MARNSVPYGRGRPNDGRYFERRAGWDDYFKRLSEVPSLEEKGAAIDELDGYWRERGWMSKAVMVSGSGQWTEIVPYKDLNPDEPTVVVADFPMHETKVILRAGPVVAQQCISGGFNVTNFIDKDNPSYRLSHHFELCSNEVASNEMLSIGPIRRRLQIKIGTLAILPLERLQATRPQIDQVSQAMLNQN